jgi:hypothetical protein
MVDLPAMSPTPDDAWTLACRAVIASLKLVPVKTRPTKSKTLTKGCLSPVLPLANKPRTLQDDLDDIRLDQLFWEDGTPLS